MKIASGRGRSFAGGVMALVALIPALALAEEKVEVMAEVVLASNKGTGVDPELAKMKDKFAQSGLSFSSFKRLEGKKLTLLRQRAAQMTLPNKQIASFKLEDIKEGTAHVKVDVASLHTTVALGREGSVFIQGGDHDGGKLVIVLSPGEGPKPRRTTTGVLRALPSVVHSAQCGPLSDSAAN